MRGEKSLSAKKNIGDRLEPKGTLDESVFYEVSTSRLIPTILPRLSGIITHGRQSVSWVKFAVMFLHNGVRCITLYLPADSITQALFGPLLNDIRFRTPAISDLDVFLSLKLEGSSNFLRREVSGIPLLPLTLAKVHLVTHWQSQRSSVAFSASAVSSTLWSTVVAMAR